MPTYFYKASECPAVQVASTLLDPMATAKFPPVTTKFLISSVPTDLIDILQELAVRMDMVSRHGGGGIAVASGLELEDGGGLTLQVSAGEALIDGLVTIPDPLTLAIAGGARSHVWLSQTGDLNAVTHPDRDPPAGTRLYLGSQPAGTAALGTPDYSGRMYLTGGRLFRRTADAGAPEDTPPASISFYAITEGGLYLWTGEEYVPLVLSLADFTASLADEVAAREDTDRNLRRLLWYLVTVVGLDIPPGLEGEFARAAAEV